ncbi:hypothetical protein C7I87_28120 [Mesorhizobium sp. SARCC-RB16n]|uniref:hypothetical protein n=1 Tax=Mesorhizobium sp. SARCC-RB16n TaxID=2116687 RepID=UPI00122F1B44|nr:hypothetical protein [Mesorhizobium sp. SARCC-RB16n]KAA3447126.1 hypothetical protein C7I87_28120 [Mesorhizobium sp. SARCC-RB16n]
MSRAGANTPGGWRGSAAQIAVGRASIIKWNRTRHLQPKCGAARKRDGEPCQNLAMANGRCPRHGGKTGKGNNWHRPVWPDGNAPGAEAKLNRKLNDLQRAAAKRAKRAAAMSPEERAAHEKWQKTHKPGSAAARARSRRERQEGVAVREMIESRPKPVPNAEAIELDRIIADRKAELERLREAEKGAFG